MILINIINNIELKVNNDFHDRFIIIDNKNFYHYGSSFKNLEKSVLRLLKWMTKKY